MIEISEEQIQTITMDHHGLVAAICQDLKIAVNPKIHPISEITLV